MRLRKCTVGFGGCFCETAAFVICETFMGGCINVCKIDVESEGGIGVEMLSEDFTIPTLDRNLTLYCKFGIEFFLKGRIYRGSLTLQAKLCLLTVPSSISGKPYCNSHHVTWLLATK